MCSSCTITQIMNHSEGSASDVVDSIPTTTADVKPVVTATIPAL